MRRTYRLFLLFLLAIGGAYGRPALAQQTRSLTPDEAVRLGITNNALLQAARADADAATASYRQTRAARLPSLRSQASYTRLSDNIPEIAFSTDFLPGPDTTFTLAPVELNRYYAEISLEQPLFSGLRLHQQIRASRHQAAAATYQATQEEADVALQIRQSYWLLYQALAVQEATQAALAQVNAHLQDVQNRRAVGAALLSDLLAVQTRRSEVELENLEANNAVRVARLELNRHTGLSLDTVVLPDAEPAQEPLAEELSTLVAHALDAQPTLKALDEQVAALDAQVKATHGAWLPEVALTGRYVYARPNQYFFTEQDAFKGTWEAGAVMRWNLFDGGAKLAETQQARARLASAQARLTAMKENVEVMVTRQYLEVQQAIEAVAVAEQIVVDANETLRMVQQQYAEGASLSALVLDAEQAARTAEARQARALANYAIARAALLHALGQTW